MTSSLPQSPVCCFHLDGKRLPSTGRICVLFSALVDVYTQVKSARPSQEAAFASLRHRSDHSSVCGGRSSSLLLCCLCIFPEKRESKLLRAPAPSSGVPSLQVVVNTSLLPDIVPLRLGMLAQREGTALACRFCSSCCLVPTSCCTCWSCLLLPPPSVREGVEYPLAQSTSTKLHYFFSHAPLSSACFSFFTTSSLRHHPPHQLLDRHALITIFLSANTACKYCHYRQQTSTCIILPHSLSSLAWRSLAPATLCPFPAHVTNSHQSRCSTQL